MTIKQVKKYAEKCDMEFDETFLWIPLGEIEDFMEMVFGDYSGDFLCMKADLQQHDVCIEWDVLKEELG